MANTAGLAKVLECTLCGDSFSERDVALGLFFASTGICNECYVKGQKISRKVWCFGKRDLRRGHKIVLKAYNEKALECQLHCPDRVICKQFILIKEKEKT
jgi:hypothetical protein